MSDIKLLNQQNVKQVLLTDWEGHAAPKQVSKEALAWVNRATLAVCRNLVASGRRSPSGRLMAPKMNAELMPRVVEKSLAIGLSFGSGAAAPGLDASPAVEAIEKFSGRPLPERLCSRAKETLAANGGRRPGFPTDPEYTSDWKYEVGNGDTILGFREWLENKKEFERAEMRAEEEHGKT